MRAYGWSTRKTPCGYEARVTETVPLDAPNAAGFHAETKTLLSATAPTRAKAAYWAKSWVRHYRRMNTCARENVA